MKAVAVSLFLLAVLLVFAAVQHIRTSTNWARCVGATVPTALVIYMFLRVARECRELERSERESASEN